MPMQNSARHARLCLFAIVALLAAPIHRFVSAESVEDATHKSQPREVIAFDRGWKFHLGEAQGADAAAFDDSSWRGVDLPHDWMIEGPPNSDPSKTGQQEGPFDRESPAKDGGAYLNGGIGWYRKTFDLPASDQGRRIAILFDGAYMNSTVWINGHQLGVRPYGFVSFSYDLTPFLKIGGEKNTLAVRLEVDQPCCRWYSGAGLYRHVWLVDTQPVHLAQWGTYITTPKIQADEAQVKVATSVQNDGSEPADVKLTTIVLDPTGKEVGRQENTAQAAAGAAASFDQMVAAPSPQLWSTEAPLLYHEVSEVRIGGALVDSVTTPFGIRTIEFTKDRGFFLNGKHVNIQGVCDHHDLGCLGSAAYRRGIERQLQILKTMGCNAIRTSHNPPSPELLELCDQMGFLVMDEAFDEWSENHQKFGYGDVFKQWSEPDLVSMLDRDRNHPSIVLWSIGNEIPEGREGKPIAGTIAKRLAEICHREDPTRGVTSACPSPANDWKSGLSAALDVFGVNYNVGWYGKNSPESQASDNSDASAYHGQLPMIGSETASMVDTRGEYGLSLDSNGAVKISYETDQQLSCYDVGHPNWANAAETEFTALDKSPWVAGEFVWTGFDYLGEPTPFKWPSRSSSFGINDLAGFPKDRYYLYQSRWSDAPMVHILPMKWNWQGFEGKTIPVRVFTNADSVELFLNGVSLGVKNNPADRGQRYEIRTARNKTTSEVKLPGYHLPWDVVYAPGELKAVAKKGGQIVATDVIHTAGAPAKIELSPDRTEIVGNGQDLSFVKVTITDADGNVCPDADNEIHFTLTGSSADIAGLDNGDATNHESFQGSQHKAFHGLALAVLKSLYDVTGPVKLIVSADGLEPNSTMISVTQPLTGAQ